MDNDINSLFFLSLATMICGFFSLALRYCYKSKCKDIDICCIKIKRDTDIEYKEDVNNIDSIRLDSPLNNNK
jgi:hypothetical protein